MSWSAVVPYLHVFWTPPGVGLPWTLWFSAKGLTKSFHLLIAAIAFSWAAHQGSHHRESTGWQKQYLSERRWKDTSWITCRGASCRRVTDSQHLMFCVPGSKGHNWFPEGCDVLHLVVCDLFSNPLYHLHHIGRLKDAGQSASRLYRFSHLLCIHMPPSVCPLHKHLLLSKEGDKRCTSISFVCDPRRA